MNAKTFGFCGGDGDFEAFLSRYPWTRFKEEADRRIAELRQGCSDHLRSISEAPREPATDEMRATVRTLFARCAANKAKMAALNQKRLAAARAGDEAGSQDAFRKLGELKPEVTETLDSLRIAILDFTGGKDPEFSKMQARVKKECW